MRPQKRRCLDFFPIIIAIIHTVIPYDSSPNTTFSYQTVYTTARISTINLHYTLYYNMDTISSPASSKVSSLFGSRSVSLTHLPATAYDHDQEKISGDRDRGTDLDNHDRVINKREGESGEDDHADIFTQERSHDPIPIYPSVTRQWSTLLVLNLAMMIDVVSGSALFVVVTHTAGDLGLAGPDATWM